MAHRQSISLLAAIGGAAIFVAAGIAAATPVTPPPGATVTTAHPVFTWTLPANEESDAVFIANKPDVTPEGKFYDENIVDLDLVASNVREWSPSSPLYAGDYWWNVWSNDRDTFASLYSVPSAFTIPVSLRLGGVKITRYRFLHALDVDVRWTANVRRPLVRVRLLRGRKIVWKASERDFGSIGSVGTTNFTWTRPKRIRQGTRLKLIASVSANGLARTHTVVVRAP